MHLSIEELQKMKEVDIRKAIPDTLVDICQIEIDRKKPVSVRVNDYIQKVKNPFLVKVGEYVVKIGYSDSDETLDDRMMQYIRKVAEIKY